MSPALTHSDRIATIAACSMMGRLERPRGREEPLGPAEWSEVAQWLHEQGLVPATLLEHGENADRFAGLRPKVASRLLDIPARAALVALELERFEHQGIWSLVRFDPDYPLRWRERLKSLAPPVLFGAGPVALLDRAPALAIVGSRDIDAELASVASSIGRAAGRAGYLVVSGGARGSDRWGMFGALEAGREAVGILHGDLAKDAGKRDTRQYIEDGLLTLAAHVHPGTGFVTGNAMARNRYIHALADSAVVIATSAGTGGTWQGSVDNFERGWSPLLVWMGDGIPDGNAALVERGGYPFDTIPDDAESLNALLAAAADHRPQTPNPQPMQAALDL